MSYDEELIARLRAVCTCNIDSTPCMAEDDCRDALDAADRIEALEAKLAKAVEALEQIQAHEEKDWVTLSGKAPPDVQDLCDIARAALKGDDHE